MKSVEEDRVSERGAAGVKLVLVLLVLFLAGNAGYNYVPVAYDAEAMKSEMSAAVMQGLALPGKVNPVDNVKARIQRAAQTNNVPADAVIDVKQDANVLTAHVAYTKPVNILPFGIYRYNYQFDHTATPTGFLLKQY
jgi:hypothetical protein